MFRWRREARGQGTVEMALVFPLVFTLAVGIFEMGFLFNAHVTLAFAAREGARLGAIYLYDSAYPQSANDHNREAGTGTTYPYAENIRDSVVKSMGLLKTSPDYFDKDHDITITYSPPAGSTLTRKGDMVNVRVVYEYPFLTSVLDDHTVTLTAQASARIE
jgi:Flp pilus assembly protein TadG